MSCRPIASTWRKPAVVTRAVRAPLSSRIMLVATVVPCSTRWRLGAAWPASPSARRMPVRNACEGSLGTLGVLARQMRPLSASCRAMSVKVPPTSTAIASALSGEAVDICVTVKSPGGRAPGPQFHGARIVDRVVAQRHAIKPARGIGADETAPHILQHRFWRPVERMTVTAAAARLDAQHVAPAHDVAVAERPQHAFVIGAGIDDDPTDAAGHATGDAPRRVLDAVDADRQHRLLGQHVVFAHDAAAAAIASGAARIPEDAIAPEPHRIT